MRGREQHRKALGLPSRGQAARQSSLVMTGWQKVCPGAGMVPVRASVGALGLGEELMFVYLSLLVLCLFFLGGHRVHMIASNKQGLIREFCADLGQELLRTG